MFNWLGEEKINTKEQELTFVVDFIVPFTDFEDSSSDHVKDFSLLYPAHEYAGEFYPVGFYKNFDIRPRTVFYLNTDLQLFTMKREYESDCFKKYKEAFEDPKLKHFDKFNLQEDHRKRMYIKLLQNINFNTPFANRIKTNLEFLISMESFKENLPNYESFPKLNLYGKQVNPLRADLRPYLNNFYAYQRILEWVVGLISNEDPEIAREKLQERLEEYKDIKTAFIGVLDYAAKRLIVRNLTNNFPKTCFDMVKTKTEPFINYKFPIITIHKPTIQKPMRIRSQTY